MKIHEVLYTSIDDLYSELILYTNFTYSSNEKTDDDTRLVMSVDIAYCCVKRTSTDSLEFYPSTELSSSALILHGILGGKKRSDANSNVVFFDVVCHGRSKAITICAEMVASDHFF